MSSALTVRPQEQRMGSGAPTSEDAGGSKRRMRRDNIVYSIGERKEYRPTWAAEPPAGALEAGALRPDGLGLLTVVVEEGDKYVCMYVCMSVTLKK